MNISVVIPVHNSVPYLDHCLATVLPQLNDNDEVLLLENGSTDESWNLCEQYAAKDERIHAVDLGPCGVSSARNAGIRLAGSDWITFVDSDDYLAENALDRAHYWSEHDSADILCLDFLPTDGDGNVIEFDSPAHHSSEKQSHVPQELLVKSALRYAYYRNQAESYGFNHTTIWTCWAKFFRTGFLRENNILFPDDLMLCEDTFFMVHSYLKAKYVISFPDNIYRYRTNENSVSRKLHPRQLENNRKLRKLMYDLIRREDTDRTYRQELAVFLTRIFIEEGIYIKASGIFNRDEAISYTRDAMKELYMKNAVKRTGYSKLIAGKKNSLTYGYVLWCLKHRKERLYFK